jgi:hypothetical protein
MDHEDNNEAEAMEAKERQLLARHHKPTASESAGGAEAEPG